MTCHFGLDVRGSFMDTFVTITRQESSPMFMSWQHMVVFHIKLCTSLELINRHGLAMLRYVGVVPCARASVSEILQGGPNQQQLYFNRIPVRRNFNA